MLTGRSSSARRGVAIGCTAVHRASRCLAWDLDGGIATRIDSPRFKAVHVPEKALGRSPTGEDELPVP